MRNRANLVTSAVCVVRVSAGGIQSDRMTIVMIGMWGCTEAERSFLDLPEHDCAHYDRRIQNDPGDTGAINRRVVLPKSVGEPDTGRNEIRGPGDHRYSLRGAVDPDEENLRNRHQDRDDRERIKNSIKAGLRSLWSRRMHAGYLGTSTGRNG